MKLLALAVLLAFAAAPGLAQQHAHGPGEPMVAIAHDAPPDGGAVVGIPAHFAAVLFGKNGSPQFHHNMRIEVALNGVPLWATTPESGHDYDGVNPFSVVFPAPGRYTVTAVAEGSSGKVLGSFEGYAAPADGAQPASLRLEAPDRARAHEPVPLRYEVVDANGNLIRHSDVLLDVRRASDRAIVFRLHTHSHQGPQALELAFPGPGEYEATLLAYQAFPDESAALFPAFVTTHRITVEPPAPGLSASLRPSPPAEPQRPNDIVVGEADEPYVLYGTFDPYTAVGPFGQIRLSALVAEGETLAPVQRVDFEATLRDALGRVLLRSASLHEYDGVLEVLAGRQAPGEYRLDVEARRGDWTGRVALPYRVLPPVAALSVGPQFVELSGLEGAASGQAMQGEFFVHDAAGAPFMHGEVDLQVLPAREGAAPIVATKLHTHDDGKFPFTLTFPEPGEYVVRATPFPLEARPTPSFHGPSLSDPLEFRVQVAEGSPLPAALPQPLGAAAGEGQRSVPGPGLALAGLALALAGLAARRRA